MKQLDLFAGERQKCSIPGTRIVEGDARELEGAWFADAPFGVVIADPPWRYRVRLGEGVAEDEYASLSVEEIADVPVQALVRPDSVLFLWATWPKLPEALEVMGGWGFDYVTGLPWVKVTSGGALSYGVGYWLRGCTEAILIGRRGDVSPPKEKGFAGLLSPNLRHSRKPKSVHEIAEALPGPYLELFARRARLGWTTFGLKVHGLYEEES